MTVKLNAPRVVVVYEDQTTGELSEIVVQTANADMTFWERFAPRLNMPTDIEKAPLTWITVLAWHALTRSPDAPAYLRPEKFSDFESIALEVRDADAEQKAGEPVDVGEVPNEPAGDDAGTPTRPDLESGY